MRGKAASKEPEMKWWKVVKNRTAGTIHGARREVGDVFQAAEAAVSFDVLEGLLEPAEAPHAPKAKAPAADAKV